jgi:hypothetical protein
MKTAVVSHSNHAELWAWASTNHRSYCHAMDYTYRGRFDTNPQELAKGRKINNIKSWLLLAALDEGFDRVMWLDHDALVVVPVALHQIAGVAEADITAVAHPPWTFTENWTPQAFNSGVMILNNTQGTRDVLEYVRDCDDEQEPWQSDWGIYFPGDQTKFVRAYHTQSPPAVWNIRPYGPLNRRMRPRPALHEVFVLHQTNINPLELRIQRLREFFAETTLDI